MRPEFFWVSGMWVFPIIMCGIMFIAVAIVLFSTFSKKGTLPCNNLKKYNSPLDIIKERYAKGEISKDEFEQMKKELSD